MPSDENVRALARVIFDFINLKVTTDSAMRAARAVLDSGLVVPAAPVGGEEELRSRLDAFITVSYGAGYIDLDDLMDLIRPHLAQIDMMQQDLDQRVERAEQIAQRALDRAEHVLKRAERAEAERDAAVERAEHKSSLAAKQLLRSARLRADLAAARQQLDQVREHAGAASYVERTAILAILDAAPADTRSGAS